MNTETDSIGSRMFLPNLGRGKWHWRLALLIVIAMSSAGGYAMLLGWFANTDFYGAHFFERGSIVRQYNGLRAIFIVVLAWLIYAPGAAFLRLAGGPRSLRDISALERYALGFVTGAGAWLVVLFCVGLAGGYTRGIA